MNARVARFHGVGRPFEIVELPLPDRLEEGEVLVTVELAAICGSDLHTVSGRRREHTPSTLGHEGVGRVMASQRSGVRAGQRVSWALVDSCGRCPMCTRHDLPQKCERLWKYGHGEDGLDGTYSTHLRIRSGTAIFPLPPTLRAEWAAAANCVLATAVEALRRLPEPGRAMVLGGGLLGLFAAGLLRERGWEVRIVEGHPGRQASTEAAGFTVETTPSNPCDLLVEAAGSAELLHQAYPCLRIGGEIRLVGLTHPASALGLSAETIIRHCWTVRGNHNYRPDSLREALAAAVRLQDSLGIDAWWGPRFPLEEIEAAFAAAETRRWLRVFLAP